MSKNKINKALLLDYYSFMYKKPIFSFIKRLFDILSSGIALIILSPLFLLLFILVKTDSKGPVFYGHKRIGKNGKIIKVWKFRSMVSDQRPLEEILTKEQLEEWHRDFKITNDPRVTKVGKFLRKTSIDEIPQLINIFTGDMSVVGWRPIIEEELQRYTTDEQKLLLSVRPGLTGYWASHGRSDTTYEDRIKLELYYPYKRSIWLDISILFKTTIGVFRHEGAK